ncbi:carboxypeptidase-like regulatory domain-containing protein [Paraflavitalea pollutisoli]|uniref:carboxypeptidase-like regulatory domain-containing protein n=1 Tax=Paraflavitalea pollutisoli TaxID=3034143 RepID=UPI0023EC0C1A|nr:carboxypeptidase-like regulatory domain-containing protein [Paraflavitalea sp. H1-2-19X]
MKNIPLTAKQYGMRTLLILLAFASITAAAQVNISFTLRAPYSAYIKDYYHLENKAVIVLTNTSRTAVDIKLGGSISNESRGVYIRTNKDFMPSMPISLGPGATTVLTANPDLMRFFDQNNIATNANDAMLANIIQTGLLPEGNYQVCINAYEYRTGKLVSDPSVGCFHFNLSRLDPPVITYPQNNHTYPAEQNNLNFSWTPPLGNLAGSLIEYDQIVVKVQPGQNPNDAIAAARDFGAGNPVVNKRKALGQSYVTQPFDLPFEKGQTYAMQVIARDRNEKVLLNNLGRSEIVTFQLGTAIQGAVNDIPISEYTGPTFNNTQLKGKLRYYWLMGGYASNRNNFGNTVAANGQNQGGQNSQGNQNNQNNSTVNGMNIGVAQGLSVIGNTSGFSGYQNSPLAGMTVQLIKATRFINPQPSGSAPTLIEGNILPGNTVLATATTTADGSFTFNVPDIDDISFAIKNTPVEYNSGGDAGGWSISGGHQTVLMVRLAAQGSSYYANPIQYLYGIPSSKDMGTLYAQVKTFRLRVLVAEADDHSLVKEGMEVMVCRRTARKSMIPKDEGSPGIFSDNTIHWEGSFDYEVIGRGISNANGEAVIEHLVLEACTDYKTPYYIISRIANPNQTDQAIGHYDYRLAYGTKAQWQAGSSCLTNGGHYINSDCAEGNCLGMLNTQQYSVPGRLGSWVEYYHIQGTYKQKPRVYAQVKNRAAGNTDDLGANQPEARWYLWKLSRAAMLNARQIAANGRWGLLVNEGQEAGFTLLKAGLEHKGTPMVMERTDVTGVDGRVNEELLPYEGYFNNSIGYYYILQVDKRGFKSAYKAINYLTTWNGNEGGDVGILKTGMAFNAGTLWLEPKGTVTLTLKNEKGTKAAADVHYYDPATGVEGITHRSTLDPDDHNQHIVTIQLPSGSNRKIVIHPTNHDLYEKDTITLSVPADEELTKAVVIKYKLHRIYFNIKGAIGQQSPQRLDKARVELLLENGNAAEMYTGLQSPWLYEGAQSNMPNTPVELPGNNNNNNNQNNTNVIIGQGNNLPPILGPYQKLTNNGGGVDFAFLNAGTSFKFRITGPDGTSYVVTDKQVNSTAGKTWKRVDVLLKRARIVKGKVTFGQMPVANARVRVKGSSPLIETFTNNNGEYTLQGVPADTILTFTASKVGHQGLEFTEGQSSTQTAYGLIVYAHTLGGGNTTTTTTINFKLRIYENLDLSRLLGFPLEVTELVENTANPARPGLGQGGVGQAAGGAGQTGSAVNTAVNTSVKISGIVNISDSANTVFKMGGSTASGKRLSTIEFSDLFVVADNIRNDSLKPYCRPRTLPMQTDINEQTITVFNFYEATLHDNTNGVTLNNYGVGNQQQGVAQGRVRIELTSFTSNSIGLDAGQTINLVNGSGASALQFPVFTANGPSVVNTSQGIGVGNANGNDLTYRLHAFNAIAAKGSSRLYKDSLTLDTRLQTNLEHVSQPNLNLPIGKVRINKDRELDDINRAVNHTTALGGTFSMQWQRVFIGAQGVRFDGTLNAAGMQMPVNNADLYPTEFWIAPGSLQTNNVKLLNAIPVTVRTGATFGYDATLAAPAWYLAITSQSNDQAAAEISGQHLSGLAANAVIPFTDIWFYSNGEQVVNLRNSLPVYKVHNIANFTLQNVFLSNTLLTLSGQLDPTIPAFPVYATGLLYEKTGANTISNMTLRPFAMNNVRVKGIDMAFNGNNSTAISFTNGQMIIKGRVSDENPDVFKNVAFTLTKTSQETQLVLDETPQKQSVRLGGSGNSPILLSNIEGRMWVTNNQWNNLYITGDMPESMGFTADGKRMRFDVLGALQVNNQKVKLKKMEAPIEGLNMSYDMANHRLMGNLSFDNKAGSMAISGDAELVVDRYGYYFMSGGAMDMSNPSVRGSAFLLFGNYKHLSSDRQSAIEDMLKEYSYYFRQLNEMPRGYTQLQQLDGFFFEAGAEIPVPGVPNFDIDLGLVDAALEVTVGGDVRLGINFGSTTTYNMGMGIFVNAYFRLGVSAIHACAGVEVGVRAGVDADGTYNTNGNYNLAVTGYIRLEGRVYAGGGLVCTSKCEGACVMSEAYGSIGFNAVGTITQDDSSFRLEVSSGSSTFPQSNSKKQ